MTSRRYCQGNQRYKRESSDVFPFHKNSLLIINLAGKEGLKPSTFAFRARCSVIELLPKTWLQGQESNLLSSCINSAMPFRLAPLEYGYFGTVNFLVGPVRL